MKARYLNLLMLTLCCSATLASDRPMATETYGNKPLSTANYDTWPGLSEVVNDNRRVYQQWVNGSEFCCYEGDTEHSTKY